jgi:Site-specific recombinase XerD
MTDDAQKTPKKFTAKHIRALTCPSHMKQTYVAVLLDVHLYVSVARAGTKSFCFRCKQDGNWRTIDLDCKFDAALDDSMARQSMSVAQIRATELTARRNKGEDVFALAKASSSVPTLQDLFDHYKTQHLEKRSKRVQENVNNFHRWFLKRNLGKRKASEFSHADTYRLHKQMERTPGSANRAMQLGRAMFNFGIKTRFLVRTDNPFSGITLYPEKERDRVLSDDEAGILIQAISEAPMKHGNERSLADLIMLWLFVGVRKTVMLSMEWAEIDDKSCVWTIPAEKMKGGKMQEILLGVTEMTVLAKRRQLLKDAGIISRFVFPSDKSASGHLEDPGNAWETLRKKLGLGDVWIHDLRRSLASAMANQGANVAIVKQALAHSDERTTLKAYIRTNRPSWKLVRRRTKAGLKLRQRQRNRRTRIARVSDNPIG